MNKILITLLSVIALGSTVSAQKIESTNVPAGIIKTFNNAYLNAENPQWEMDYDNYVVKFKKNKVETSATYNKDGKWVKSETPVTRSSMPSAVKETLSKEFGSYKENDIERVDKPDGVVYQIDLENNQINYEVIISDKGELISKDQVKEYKKDYSVIAV
jgi:hypothetical protein